MQRPDNSVDGFLNVGHRHGVSHCFPELLFDRLTCAFRSWKRLSVFHKNYLLLYNIIIIPLITQKAPKNSQRPAFIKTDHKDRGIIGTYPQSSPIQKMLRYWVKITGLSAVMAIVCSK